MREARDIEQADVLYGFRRVGQDAAMRRIVLPLLIRPRRINHENTIRPIARQRRRLGAE